MKTGGLSTQVSLWIVQSAATCRQRNELLGTSGKPIVEDASGHTREGPECNGIACSLQPIIISSTLLL